MNSKNSKTSEPYRPLFNFVDKINLKRGYIFTISSNLGIYFTQKNIKK